MNPFQLKNKTILCFALTWGMGHTTRLAALMKILAENRNKLIILGNERQIRYYEQLNLGEQRIVCRSYEVRYYRYIPLWLSVLIQLPMLVGMMYADRRLARRLAGEFHPDLIISDNRYGFFSPPIPSFLLTHQVWPLFLFFRKTLHRWMHKKIYKHFTEIWVPDLPDASVNLSGILSQPGPLHNVRCIGWLSVYAHIHEINAAEEPFDELWLLTGPENEQKRFFNYLLKKHAASSAFASRKIAVCGSIPLNFCHPNLIYYRFPDPRILKDLLLRSGRVFARIGYTTLMDVCVLNILQKTEFSPTPGQPEQHYLYERHICNIAGA